MKQLLQQLGQDSRRHAAEELRQRLDAEMAKPAEQRDYALIEDLSAACCELMGVRRSAEASVPQGIQAVLDRVNGREPEEAEEIESGVVEIVKPSFWRFIPVAAACLMLTAGVIGGGMLLRMDPGEKLPAPQPDASENFTLETQAQTEGFTVPVAVPLETDPATEAMTMETVMPETVLVTDATAPTESHAAPKSEPQSTQAAVTPATQTTTAPLPPDPTEPMTETTTETIPAPTEPEERPTEPATENKPTTRLIKLNYELGWIPEGYALTSEELEQADDYEIRILTYTSDAGTIMFRQRTRNAPPLAPYETDELPEDCTMQNIRIGPYTGYLAQDSSGCTLTWDVGEYLFTLTGDDADELQKASLMLRIRRSSKTENEQDESL